jgi:hypothetical protein
MARKGTLGQTAWGLWDPFDADFQRAETTEAAPVRDGFFADGVTLHD